MYDMGMRLRELREAKGLSMPELASKIGVSKSTVQRHENNTQTPTAEHIKQLALLYRVSSDYILGLDNRKVFVVSGLTEEQEHLIVGFISEMTGKNMDK